MKKSGVFVEGARFGKLVVVSQKKNTIVMKCDCGNTIHVSKSRMNKTPIMSCGCINTSGYPYMSVRDDFKMDRVVDPRPVSMGDSISDITDKWIRAFEGEERVTSINDTYKTDYAFPTVPRRNSRNTSGRVGVHFNKKVNKWQSYICFRGKQIYLGYYENFEDAVQARADAERDLFSPAVTSKNNL